MKPKHDEEVSSPAIAVGKIVFITDSISSKGKAIYKISKITKTKRGRMLNLSWEGGRWVSSDFRDFLIPRYVKTLANLAIYIQSAANK